VRHIKKLVFAAIIIMIIIVSIVNIFALKNYYFWKISVGNCLTLIVALVITYYFSKKNKDDDNKKAILLDLFHKFDDLINDEKLVNITDNTDKNYILMKKRQISNYLVILKNNAKKFRIEEEIGFIEKKANEYMTLIGEHQDNLEYLSERRDELMRPIELINPKLVEAMIKLYD